MSTNTNPINTDATKRALTALAAYARETDMPWTADAIIGIAQLLICDLGHAADTAGVAFEDLAEGGIALWQSERTETGKLPVDVRIYIAR